MLDNFPLIAVGLWCAWCFAGDVWHALTEPAYDETIRQYSKVANPFRHGPVQHYPSDAPTIVRK